MRYVAHDILRECHSDEKKALGQRKRHLTLVFVDHFHLSVRLLQDVVTVTVASVLVCIVMGFLVLIETVVTFSFIGGVSDGISVIPCEQCAAENIATDRELKGTIFLSVYIGIVCIGR